MRFPCGGIAIGERPRGLTILNYASVVLLLTATGLVFFYAPLEAVMGEVQRIFYFHVSSWWVSMLGLLAAAITGIVYLVTKDHRWDIWSLSAVEISVVFGLIGIVTGSIWARPAWNTWWTWDPRLTTATIMLLIYTAYLLLRQGIDDPDRRARFGAVYVILGFISVPITFFSIRLYRTIHPVVIGANNAGAQGEFDMTFTMVQVFLFSLLTFTVLFITLIWNRYRLGELSDEVDRERLRVSA
ncbi:MAG TPA: cytochrome c biogenesis protein CcsA [Anaerolineales bacterium]|nr:cytochrome c biogenesis protein CcsA [Anaerolineales bacterium]